MPDHENILYADGLEDAFIGIIHSKGSQPKACYDYDKCINIFKSRDGMTHEEAIEWMDYNVVGAWVGETTPIFVHEIPSDQKIDEFLEELGFDQPANDN